MIPHPGQMMGKKILYSFNGDIWMMDSDGFNPETLLLGHSALCPTFSPDQKSVAFYHQSR